MEYNPITVTDLNKYIKNMQKYNVKDEDIMKYTNTTLEELETIKKMKMTSKN